MQVQNQRKSWIDREFFLSWVKHLNTPMIAEAMMTDTTELP